MHWFASSILVFYSTCYTIANGMNGSFENAYANINQLYDLHKAISKNEIKHYTLTDKEQYVYEPLLYLTN